jgi:single-strand DNA-binding protein
MSGEPYITVIGNATADAELRYTASGMPIARWTLAFTPRVKAGDSWVDGEPTFYRCSAFRQLAETTAETITRGMRLIVYGRFKTRQYEKDGEKRLSVEIDVEGVGPELRFATATVNKASRSSGGAEPRRPAAQPSDDPWQSAPADEEAPF